MKERKKTENLKYKEKLKLKRLVNTTFNARMKSDQCKWQKRSREKKKKKENKQRVKAKSAKETPKTRKPNSYTVFDSLRKKATRLSKQMPESPTSWVKTVGHLIKKATPRRKSKLLTVAGSSEVNDNL